MPDYRSPQAQQYRHWYKTALWQNIRRQQIATEPLCRICKDQGQITAATVCDHVEPHKGDRKKFFDGPFQSLCKPHHDSAKQREERQGFSDAIGADGWPTDDRHPANQ